MIAVEVFFPHPQLIVVSHRDLRQARQEPCPHIVRVAELCILLQLDLRKYTERVLAQLRVLPLKLAVIKPGAILARIQVLGQEQQVLDIELKLPTHLVPQLVDAVKPLQKTLTPVVHIFGRVVAQTLLKHMAEAEPVFSDQGSEAFKSAEPRVHHELDQGTQLTGAVPPI